MPHPAPGGPEDAWDSWDRKGVTQFRLSHFFLSRYRHILEAELPDVAAAIERDGGLRFNPTGRHPRRRCSGGLREGDERFELLSGRRAVVERAVASVAGETRVSLCGGVWRSKSCWAGRRPLLAYRTSPACGPWTARSCGPTSSSTAVAAGPPCRRGWKRSGPAAPVDEVEDSGFIYLARHFRSRDGQLPFALGPLLQSYGSISVLTLPADNATWSVTLIARSGDRALLGLKDVARWEAAVRSLPTVAHWIDGDPIEERIITMAKIEDRIRELRPGGLPVATGILAVADAWACTNPSVGRGASIGMLHAQTLRDTLRHTGPDRPGELSEAFAVATADIVEPWYKATLAFDRHRLAEMAAEANGATYEPDDPAYEMTGALAAASSRDPDVLRAFLDIVGVLDLPQDVMARPGMFEKIIEFGADWRTKEAIGPNRDQLVAMATG